MDSISDIEEKLQDTEKQISHIMQLMRMHDNPGPKIASDLESAQKRQRSLEVALSIERAKRLS